jgi:hypothetical protein
MDEEVKKKSYRRTGRSIGAKLCLTIASTFCCDPPRVAATATGRPAIDAKTKAIRKAERTMMKSPFLSLEFNVRGLRSQEEKVLIRASIRAIRTGESSIKEIKTISRWSEFISSSDVSRLS